MNKSVITSVIVPCFNQGQYLETCINSLLNQTFQHWECLIIDDGSTDNTKEIAYKLMKTDFRIKYFFKTNGGLSSSRNFGIKHALGEYILPLDADDYISSNYLEFAHSRISESNLIKVVFGVVKNFGTLNHWGDNQIIFDFKTQLYCNQIHCSGLYKRNDAILVGGYDENMKLGFEDWEFYIRLLGGEGTAIQIPNITLFYRRKEDSMLTNLINGSIKLNSSNYIVSQNIEYYNKYNLDIVDALSVISQLKKPENHFSYYFLFKLFFLKLRKTLKIQKNKCKTN